jgi:trans-2-enoyl-CoA reductase
MEDSYTNNYCNNRADFEAVHERLKGLGGFMVVSEEYVQSPQFKRLMSDVPAPKLALNAVGGNSATELARILR